MNEKELSSVAINLYNAFIDSDKQAEERIKYGIEGALKLKEVDESAFYAALAIGLTEVATKLNLGESAGELVEKVVKYFAQKSEYLRNQ
ncbi:hypothetical protein KY342_05355 [Candidatus Woesearchaeota archaeon]|nr:hypothetical protein [Candidatus Woesearchaeota archaeon]